MLYYPALRHDTRQTGAAIVVMEVDKQNDDTKKPPSFMRNGTAELQDRLTKGELTGKYLTRGECVLGRLAEHAAATLSPFMRVEGY